ncbi:hypothetical protein [Actinacidiphila paucisporea]|uniref:Alpha/beta hydrolase family protein n=1 Tax=Actinacidiphila paucisporea TaxID=310782 RepID=A0A1M7MP31_9ACTN|nr:hypothetical protein [Actinacidiphila paucisporea]SHM92276.1 hypothetical protein SAMN05216499_116109 [Actinacidiphila paucisporea]
MLSRLTPDTKVVLAHSLGTVVAYEALHRLEHPLPLLVTFGSPLGLRSIIRGRLRPQPLRSPGHLKRWVNIADRDDFIVATLRLRTLLPDSDAVLERTRLVKNRNTNPYAATEYLKHWQTVEPVAEILVRRCGTGLAPARAGSPAAAPQATRPSTTGPYMKTAPSARP